MTSPETRLREAFAAVALPPQLNERTLAAIEQQRANCEDAASSASLAENNPAPMPNATPTKPHPTARSRQSRSPRVHTRALGRAVAIAACLAFAFAGINLALAKDPLPDTTNVPTHGAPAAFITLDVNPSLEFALDEHDVVLLVHGLNNDGASVLQSLEAEGVNLVSLPAGEALGALSASASFSRYLADDAYVALSVVCDDETQRARLRHTGDAYLADLPCQGSCRTASSEEHRAAAQAGMGVQRYRAAQELMELDQRLTWSDCENMSMRELRDRITTLQGEENRRRRHANP